MENKTTKLSDEKLRNIAEMEQILNKTESFNAETQHFLAKWEALLPEIEKLSDYYYNGEWMADYEAANRGEIPAEMPHGVLSEDAVYNVTGEHYLNAVSYLKLITKIIAKAHHND